MFPFAFCPDKFATLSVDIPTKVRVLRPRSCCFAHFSAATPTNSISRTSWRVRESAWHRRNDEDGFPYSYLLPRRKVMSVMPHISGSPKNNLKILLGISTLRTCWFSPCASVMLSNIRCWDPGCDYWPSAPGTGRGLGSCESLVVTLLPTDQYMALFNVCLCWRKPY